MNAIRALIVDDEPLARRRIRKLLDAHDDVEIVGECGNGRDAIEKISRAAPDLVFLDVQMPEVDGFEVVRLISPKRMPCIIFVTAYEQHALRAFEVAAIDYLLKPFDAARFAQAIQRARDRIAAGARGRRELESKLAAALAQARSNRYQTRLAVKEDGRVLLVQVDQIHYVEASGKHVRLHTASQVHELRDSLAALQKLLDPAVFARIHRSTLVNVNEIVELEPTFHGEFSILLRSGRRLTLSRGYRGPFRDRFGGTI